MLSLQTLLKPASGLMYGGGLLLVISSLGEHLDVVLLACGVLLAIVGWWLRGWMTRREAFESATHDLLSKQETAIAELKLSGAHRNEAIQALRKNAEHEANWRLWVAVTLSGLAHDRGLKVPELPRPKEESET